MNDIRIDDALRAISDERQDLPDAPTVRAQLMGIPLQDVPQERRWLPRLFEGTYHSLSSAAKFAAAAAVVALFGAFLVLGVLLPATDDDRPAATPSASPTASAEPTPSAEPTASAKPVPTGLMAPAPVTGQADLGSDDGHGSRLWEDGVTRIEDGWYQLAWDATDPRLTGEAMIRHNSFGYGRIGLWLSSGTVVLETTDGRWVGDTSNLTAADIATTTMILRGEDDYEGLTAYVVVAENGEEPPTFHAGPPTFHAAVFPGEMPVYVRSADASASPEPDDEIDAADGADVEPAVVTGTASYPEVLAGGSRSWDGERVVGTSMVEEYAFEATDPRLAGTLTSLFDYIFYESLGLYVAQGENLLETADGRWVGDFTFVGGDALRGIATTTLYGEGPYEGLTASIVLDFDAEPISFTGGIITGDLPLPPDPS